MYWKKGKRAFEYRKVPVDERRERKSMMGTHLPQPVTHLAKDENDDEETATRTMREPEERKSQCNLLLPFHWLFYSSLPSSLNQLALAFDVTYTGRH